MLDLRPVVRVIGVIVATFGVAMLPPMLLDLFLGNGTSGTFGVSGFVTFMLGLIMALATWNSRDAGLTIKQTYLLTASVFAVLPVFGAIPFIVGPANLSFTDAFFEAMSGLTTTGATIMTDISQQHEGLLLWRGMLQWFGGVSVIIVALAFLPLLGVGGMELFRWDSDHALGNVLPRAAEVTRTVSTIYLGFSVTCCLAYLLAGLKPLDAVVYAMTTMATGGFGNYDDSFQSLGPAAEYVGALFMFLAALPFLRYGDVIKRKVSPLFSDSQISTFVKIIFVIVMSLLAWQIFVNDVPLEEAFRKSLFNGISILTGTGFVSDDYGAWGAFPVTLIFIIGFIGGCAGSTTCSIKVFRFQLLFATILARVLKLRSPHMVNVPRYDGKQVAPEVVNSVLLFLIVFFFTLAVTTVLLSLTGLDFITSLSGAASALANIGPGLGDEIGPNGNYAELEEFAKWVLSFVMLAGRLELFAVFAVLSISFWRQ